jgi:hypothetical protein
MPVTGREGVEINLQGKRYNRRDKDKKRREPKPVLSSRV